MSFTKCRDCVNYYDCLFEESHNILEYSGHSTFRNCTKRFYKDDNEFFEEYRNIPKDFSYVMFDDIIPEDANESYTLMINLFERGLKNDLL